MIEQQQDKKQVAPLRLVSDMQVLMLPAQMFLLRQHSHLHQRIYDLIYHKVSISLLKDLNEFTEIKVTLNQIHQTSKADFKAFAGLNDHTSKQLDEVLLHISNNRAERTPLLKQLILNSDPELLRYHRQSALFLQQKFIKNFQQILRNFRDQPVKFSTYHLNLDNNNMQIDHLGFSRSLLQLYFGPQKIDLYAHIPNPSSPAAHECELSLLLSKFMGKQTKKVCSTFTTFQNIQIPCIVDLHLLIIPHHLLKLYRAACFYKYQFDPTVLSRLAHLRSQSLQRGDLTCLSFSPERRKDWVTHYCSESVQNSAKVKSLT